MTMKGRPVARFRILQPGDEATLEAFLLPRVESSMFLIGNMRTSGLVDNGQAYEGTYAAAFEGEQITGVVAHCWNGNLICQAPAHLDDLWRAAVKASSRPVSGLLGPAEQVAAVKAALDLTGTSVQLDESENLFSLALDQMAVPRELSSGRWRGRRAGPRDLDQVTAWRVDFSLEALGEEDEPQLWEKVRVNAERIIDRGMVWVLEDGGELVATSGFNAAIDEAVQVGGVWTPPALRRRGYGRAAVAASLLDARAEGAETAILFTGESNIPAQKAYRALGFRVIGDYRLVLLRKSVEFRSGA